MAKYSRIKTGITPTNDSNEYMDLLRPKSHVANDDVFYEIEPNTIIDPDLLAYDLYGNPNYGGCLFQRNMDTVPDPNIRY